MTTTERIDAAIERVQDEIKRWAGDGATEPRQICKTILEALRFQKAALGEVSDELVETVAKLANCCGGIAESIIHAVTSELEKQVKGNEDAR